MCRWPLWAARMRAVSFIWHGRDGQASILWGQHLPCDQSSGLGKQPKRRGLHSPRVVTACMSYHAPACTHGVHPARVVRVLVLAPWQDDTDPMLLNDMPFTAPAVQDDHFLCPGLTAPPRHGVGPRPRSSRPRCRRQGSRQSGMSPLTDPEVQPFQPSLSPHHTYHVPLLQVRPLLQQQLRHRLVACVWGVCAGHGHEPRTEAPGAMPWNLCVRLCGRGWGIA